MIFFLGVLSLVQVLFLPGIILLKLFNLKRGMIQTIVFAFGLSLVFNFLWVLLLTSLKINFPIVHYGLFMIEVGLVIWIYRQNILVRTEELSAGILLRAEMMLETIKNFIQKDAHESSLARVLKTLVGAIFFIWALAGIFWVAKLMVNEFGTAFKLWDAVVSWNSWAGEWFNNTIPSPKRYPQLIPANFSVTYSFLGSTDIQIFAKSFMPLFTLFTWLLLLDLAFEFKQPGIFIGMVILRYMTKKFLGEYLAEGYVDVALLFFSFLTIYSLLKASKGEKEDSKLDYLYLGGIFAAGTALAKQNGLLVFGFYPLLALLLVLDDSSKPLIDRIKKLIKPVGLGLLILLPWYLLNESRILLGLNSTNVEVLVSSARHSGRDYGARAIRAVDILGIYKFLFPLALASLPVISKKFRWIGALMIFPYTIIWMFLFSIFARNLAMVFPFLAMIVGMGVYSYLDLCLKLSERIKLPQLRVVYYFILLLLILIGASQVINDAKLSTLQTEEQKNALLYKTNQQLYAYFEDQGGYAPIMTQYPIEHLPELGPYKIPEPFAIYKEFYENFTAHPETAYFLVWGKYADPDVKVQIDHFEDLGAVEFLFTEYNMQFYKVLDREVILAQAPIE
jgi:hypothetical protein